MRNIMYKIVDCKDGQIYTLFHGVDGSKKIPRKKRLKAAKKMVTDGNRQNPYLSGFHVMPTVDSAILYLKKFKYLKHKLIVSCYVENIRPKRTSGVFLADEIEILGEAFDTELDFGANE